MTSVGVTVAVATPAPAGNSVLAAAIVSALVTLTVGILTLVAASWRDRTTRGYERVRAGLREARDCCVVLRRQLREYGAIWQASAGAPTPQLLAAQGRFDLARESVDVAVTNVDPIVAEAVQAWVDAAQFRFLATSDVSEDSEHSRWEDLLAIIGAALNDPAARIRPLEQVRKRAARSGNRRAPRRAGRR